MKKKASVRYVGGTLVLEEVAQSADIPPPFQWLSGRWRCEAVHYKQLAPWFQTQGIRDRIPEWQQFKMTLHDPRDPHDYQSEALKAWQKADCWGSIVLPTGSGKTFVALRAIVETGVSTLVVVPTIDLLHQWYTRLHMALQMPIGVWYGQEKNMLPITVTTYPSAWAHGEALGNQFKLLIFDEIHHLPAPSWHEIALICAAPCRLGLTATYPGNETDGTQRAALLKQLVGSVVYTKRIDDLTGKQLANYRTERIRVDLTPDERVAYDAAYDVYTGFVRESRLRERHGRGWWETFTRMSAFDQGARRAKVAELKLKEIVYHAEAKIDVVERLLCDHVQQPMLIFTAHNRFAYMIGRCFLIPVITHQTKSAERHTLLTNFRAGHYRAIVTSRVLNEGVDVPEAKVAVILGGNASARDYIQRLGRVLRKHGNTEAVLYEVIARKTVDERIAAQRRRNQKKANG